MRKGMGRGQGSGWKNLRCDDSRRHSLASKGVKTAQKLPSLAKVSDEQLVQLYKINVTEDKLNAIQEEMKKRRVDDVIDNIDKEINQMPITQKEKDLLKMVELTYYDSQNQWSADRIGSLYAETHLSRYYDITKSRAKKIIMDLLNRLEEKTKD